MANFDQAVTKTFVREGGSKITKDPADKGWLTRYGISKRSFPDIDIDNLTEELAKQLYKTFYWEPVWGTQINNQVTAESIFDFAVNAGVQTASHLAQESVGVAADGVIGTRTLEALNATSPYYFLRNFAFAKIKYYTSICNHDATQKKYYFGWVSRCLEGL